MWRFQALRFALRRIGLLGWVGLMLSVLSIAYAMIIAPQQRAAVNAVADETARLHQRRMALEKKPRTSAENNAPVKAEIELPKIKTTPEMLLALEKIAARNKLQLNRISYAYAEREKAPLAVQPAGKPVPQAQQMAQTSKPVPLLEVRMTVPVSGRYASIRAFVAQALIHRPALALDSMLMTREAIGQSDIQAQLRFTMFMRPDE